MRVVRAVLNYLLEGKVKYLFGIPAGSVNAFFDELTDLPEIQPIVVKHEGAAGYIAAAYARATGQLAVCIGASGPGATNLVTGAANAMREHVPILFITGHVPVQTQGWNASQELNAQPLFQPVTKYSVTVQTVDEVMPAMTHAIRTALSGVPGPVHVAIPINIQLSEYSMEANWPTFPTLELVQPDVTLLLSATKQLLASTSGIIFIGQGARGAIDEVLETATLLGWPIFTTPQAKGLIPSRHPLLQGVYGFAGDELCISWLEESNPETILIIGSSLGETATNNYHPRLTANRLVIQIDLDESVFRRAYPCDVAILGDAKHSLHTINNLLVEFGLVKQSVSNEIPSCIPTSFQNAEFNTENTLKALQYYLPKNTKYTVDIGEFMAYVIHHMQTISFDSFDINVHFGPMGIGLSSAIGWKLGEPQRTVVSITGDGCFFMHGMELLTAKEQHLPILWVVFNNSRLGMVHQGHRLQYGRVHTCFTQTPIAITAFAEAMGIRGHRVERLEDINGDILGSLLSCNEPTVLEIALVDDSIPPMGDRVKFLSSFAGSID